MSRHVHPMIAYVTDWTHFGLNRGHPVVLILRCYVGRGKDQVMFTFLR